MPLKILQLQGQHGFFRGRTTTTNLYGYVNYILNSLGRGKEVHPLYTDFSKAFDMVDHKILLEMLSWYVVRSVALQWLRSYLDRYLQVRVNGHISSEFGVASEDLQGGSIFNTY